MNKKNIKKWFFAINSEVDRVNQYQQHIKIAVNSALENTSLEPHCLYDNTKGDIEIIKWLEEKNIKIHRFHSRFINEIESQYKNSYSQHIAKGAWLRAEIPAVVKNNYKDEYILYTDCDVIFLENFSFNNDCEFFACAPEFIKNNWEFCNTGVMVMNINNLYNTLKEFSDFVISYGIDKHESFDQGAYNTFYKNKWDKLDILYNWKPYWGINNKAKIIHFHGAKIEDIEQLINNEIDDIQGNATYIQQNWEKYEKFYKYYYKILKNYL